MNANLFYANFFNAKTPSRQDAKKSDDFKHYHEDHEAHEGHEEEQKEEPGFLRGLRDLCDLRDNGMAVMIHIFFSWRLGDLASWRVLPETAPLRSRLVRRRLLHSGGFTFIEVLVAMTIVAIVLPIAMAGLSLALSLSDNARQRDQAVSLASAQLHLLIVTDQWQTGPLSGNFAPAWPGYSWQAAVGPWNGTAGGGVGGVGAGGIGVGGDDPVMDQLQVTVMWNDRHEQKALTLTTLVSPTTTPGATGSTGGAT